MYVLWVNLLKGNKLSVKTCSFKKYWLNFIFALYIETTWEGRFFPFFSRVAINNDDIDHSHTVLIPAKKVNNLQGIIETIDDDLNNNRGIQFRVE